MAKKPKQPKLRKMPKKPKQSASATAWIKFSQRCADVTKENAHKQSEWKAKVNKLAADHKKKLEIIRKYSR